VHTHPGRSHDGRVTRGYLFNCLRLVEPVLRTRVSFGAALSQKAGAGAQTTRGGPRAARARRRERAVRTRDGLGAAPSRETGVGAAGTHGGLRAASSREAGAGALGHVDMRVRLIFCLDV
jgi:hypothetical protein